MNSNQVSSWTRLGVISIQKVGTSCMFRPVRCVTRQHFCARKTKVDCVRERTHPTALDRRLAPAL